MTTTPEKAPAPAAADLVNLTIDGVEVAVPRAPSSSVPRRRRASRSRASATTPAWTRSAPAASAWSRCGCPARPDRTASRPRPVRCRPSRPDEAAGVLHDDRRPGHGRQDPVHLRGHRQGPARCHGAAPHQPPARLPGLRQGRRVPLQNQAMSNGRATSRFEDIKRTYPKPINISSQVLLDRERCVLCARCTRFSDQVAGDPSSPSSSAAPSSRWASTRSTLRVLLLGQHRADLPGRGPHRLGLPLPQPPLRPRVDAERL